MTNDSAPSFIQAASAPIGYYDKEGWVALEGSIVSSLQNERDLPIIRELPII